MNNEKKLKAITSQWEATRQALDALMSLMDADELRAVKNMDAVISENKTKKALAKSSEVR